MNSKKRTQRLKPLSRVWKYIGCKFTKRSPSAAAKIIILRDASGNVSIEMGGSASSVIHALTTCLVDDGEFNRAVLNASLRAQVSICESMEAAAAIDQLINEILSTDENT